MNIEKLENKLQSLVISSKPFKNDEERLEDLFKLYEKMIEEEKT